MMRFPLQVNVFDAKTSSFHGALLLHRADGCMLNRVSDRMLDTPYFLSPGWIDLHTHIFDGVGVFGIDANRGGRKAGVCLLCDAGTVGEYTLHGFRKYHLPHIETPVKVFLCISPIGVIFHHEYNEMSYLDAERTANVIEKNRDLIYGVKVRIGKEVIRHEGVEPLRLAAQCARQVNLPLMVHIGGVPPELEEVEPYLERGDILTHCFNGRGRGAWNEDGTPTEAMRRIIEKGVYLDVGHGGGSFSYKNCEGGLKNNLPRVTISTDLHSSSVRAGVFDLQTVMSKVLSCGQPLEKVIWGVTQGPAEALGIKDWCDLSGYIKNATIFTLNDVPPFQIEDCEKQVRALDKLFTAQAVVSRGRFERI